jgi:glycosyltransferase involved in cell wall biosynthesis
MTDAIRARRPVVVALGMMTKMPVPGVVWQTIHYLRGFLQLGVEVWYVEDHGAPPLHFCRSEDDLGTARAAKWLAATLERFGLGDRWAYRALHDRGQLLGMSEKRLHDLYRCADLVLNLHGGTTPRAEHAASGRLVYLETDPVRLQLELHEDRAETVAFLDAHVAFFTFAENYGSPSSGLPVDDRFLFHPTRQPVVLDLWANDYRPRPMFTTIGNWRQRRRDVAWNGVTYTWSKHREWMKFLEVPKRTAQKFELALASYEAADAARLAEHGWDVVSAADRVADVDSYRDFIVDSLAEFTVAKDQNVRFNTGWFSDRSATYLAAGRPVVTQDTGFGRRIPTGEGLFSFSTADEAVAAVDEVASDPARHAKAAAEIGREYFDARIVLRQLLEDVDA